MFQLLVNVQFNPAKQAHRLEAYATSTQQRTKKAAGHRIWNSLTDSLTNFATVGTASGIAD
jgi:hypothetical protein